MEFFKLQRTGEAPPGGWQYYQQETGRSFSHHVFSELFVLIHQHRVAMKLPIPVDWRQDVIQQMCPKLPKGWCIGGPPEPPPTPQNRRAAFVAAAATRSAAGLKAITFEVYENLRHAVCLQCDQFRGEHGIGLIACQACGCTHLKAWAEETDCPLNKWHVAVKAVDPTPAPVLAKKKAAPKKSKNKVAARAVIKDES